MLHSSLQHVYKNESQNHFQVTSTANKVQEFPPQDYIQQTVSNNNIIGMLLDSVFLNCRTQHSANHAIPETHQGRVAKQAYNQFYKNRSFHEFQRDGHSRCEWSSHTTHQDINGRNYSQGEEYSSGENSSYYLGDSKDMHISLIHQQSNVKVFNSEVENYLQQARQNRQEPQGIHPCLVEDGLYIQDVVNHQENEPMVASECVKKYPPMEDDEIVSEDISDLNTSSTSLEDCIISTPNSPRSTASILSSPLTSRSSNRNVSISPSSISTLSLSPCSIRSIKSSPGNTTYHASPQRRDTRGRRISEIASPSPQKTKCRKKSQHTHGQSDEYAQVSGNNQFPMNNLQKKKGSANSSAVILNLPSFLTLGTLNDSDSDDDSSDTSNSSNQHKSRYKTELCRSWEETGYCRYGEKCQFAHGKHELRQVSRHHKYKSELCNNYHYEGTCMYGIRCCFIHNINKKVIGKAISQNMDLVPIKSKKRLSVFVKLCKSSNEPVLKTINIKDIDFDFFHNEHTRTKQTAGGVYLRREPTI